MWATVVRGATDVGRLCVPVACAGCGLPDVRWCDACAAVWWDTPARSESGAGRLDQWGRAPLPVWSLAPLTGPAHAMVSAWKDAHRRDLDPFFCQAMGRLTAAVLPALRSPCRPLVVVPAPARPSSTRRRGADLPRMLAKAAAHAMRAKGIPATAHHALVIGAGEARHQSARGRWRSQASMRVVTAPQPGAAVVLVDDVVTTGATLASCTSSLEAVGATVVAALTLAATDVSSRGAQSGLG